MATAQIDMTPNPTARTAATVAWLVPSGPVLVVGMKPAPIRH